MLHKSFIWPWVNRSFLEWLLTGIYLFIIGSLFAGAILVGQDRGLNTPLTKLRNQYADLLSQAEREIPRSQKFQILNSIRHRLKADSKSKDHPQKLFELAEQYKRYRFYDEALTLYAQVDKNPASNDDLRMRANRCLGEVEFVANDNLKAAIDYLKKSVSLSPDNSLNRGDLLGRLGTYYFANEQIDRMLETFAAFNKLPDHVKNALPDIHLKANLYSARFIDDADKANQYFERARKVAIANPEQFPASLILGIFSEQNAGQPWNSPGRIKRLVVLIEDKKFSQQPQIREYVMDVLLAYFLERDKDWKRFEKFADQAIKLFGKLESGKKSDTLSYSLRCQSLGVWVGAAEQAEKKWDQATSPEDFQEWQNKLKRMSFYVPNQIKQQDLRDIMKAYRRGENLLKAGSNKEPGNKDPKKQRSRKE